MQLDEVFYLILYLNKLWIFVDLKWKCMVKTTKFVFHFQIFWGIKLIKYLFFKDLTEKITKENIANALLYFPNVQCLSNLENGYECSHVHIFSEGMLFTGVGNNFIFLVCREGCNKIVNNLLLFKLFTSFIPNV